MPVVTRRGFVESFAGVAFVTLGAEGYQVLVGAQEPSLVRQLTRELLDIVERSRATGFRAEHARQASSILRLAAASFQASGVDAAVRDTMRSQVDKYGVDYFTKAPDLDHYVRHVEQTFKVDLGDVPAKLTEASRAIAPGTRRRHLLQALADPSVTASGTLWRAAQSLHASAGNLASRERRDGIINAGQSGTCDALQAEYMALELSLVWVCAGFPLACDMVILSMLLLIVAMYQNGC